ncbi:hypothetical protein [Streptomyces sp.]|uniref:hypothetical protein n=1 Tax=Streptomyces sp. TaxID=1931 RepID=UPI0028114072|nr:hypothetical protein [Streptomyces sp.]
MGLFGGFGVRLALGVAAGAREMPAAEGFCPLRLPGDDPVGLDLDDGLAARAAAESK